MENKKKTTKKNKTYQQFENRQSIHYSLILIVWGIHTIVILFLFKVYSTLL